MSKKNQTTGELLDNPDTRPHTGSTSNNQAIEQWLSVCYDFRYNIIKQKPEWKPVGSKIAFKGLDKYKLLSIKRELDAGGYKVSKDGLLDILYSSYSPAINPVKEYFKQVFPWDEETDHIKELCDTVKTKNNELWYPYLKKWLVAVVANVFIDEYCANHTMLVLTGTQGKFKTTWIENLCPKELKHYLFSSKIDLRNKDVFTMIAEYFILNIDDQLKQINKKDENELKNLITVNHVKYRRPYDPIVTEYPHLASFTATVNGNEFLSDTTGSRRFLPFEVDNIDIKAAQNLSMEKVWAQAYFLFKSGFRYWFNEEEVDTLNKRNEEFAMISQEEELLNFYFSPKTPKNMPLTSLKLYPNSIILAKLETYSRLRLSAKKMGEALAKLGFVKKQKTVEGKVNWVWLVYEKTNIEVERQQFEESEAF
ncbi:MAG: virulence protein [Bacteroidetes bacterium]|nr:virulence protein [Bacteroidota bacterium]